MEAFTTACNLRDSGTATLNHDLWKLHTLLRVRRERQTSTAPDLKISCEPCVTEAIERHGASLTCSCLPPAYTTTSPSKKQFGKYEPCMEWLTMVLSGKSLTFALHQWHAHIPHEEKIPVFVQWHCISLNAALANGHCVFNWVVWVFVLIMSHLCPWFVWMN